jgi:hypothetical protein
MRYRHHVSGGVIRSMSRYFKGDIVDHTRDIVVAVENLGDDSLAFHSLDH